MFKYNVTPGFLTKEECNFIVEELKHGLKLRAAEIKNNEIDTEFRDSSVAFITLDDLPKIKDKLIPLLVEMVKVKGYDLNFDNQPVQFTEYIKGQHYTWHQDARDEFEYSSKRYCSLVIQLNEGYEGGELQVKTADLDGNEADLSLEKGIGNLFVFLSSVYHRVSPVTEGVRYSLVSWFTLKPVENYKKTLL